MRKGWVVCRRCAIGYDLVIHGSTKISIDVDDAIYSSRGPMLLFAAALEFHERGTKVAHLRGQAEW